MADAAGWPLPRRVALVALGERPGRGRRAPPGLPPECSDRLGAARAVPAGSRPGRARAASPGSSTRCAAGTPPWARRSRCPGRPRRCAGRARRWPWRLPGHHRLPGPPCALRRAPVHAADLLRRGAGPARCAPPGWRRSTGSARRSRTGSPRPCWPGCSTAATPTRWPRCAHVHPQTVRYRLRQIDDLFGDQLRIPTAASSWRSRCGRGRCSGANGPDCLRTGRPTVLAVARRGPLNHLLEQPILSLDRLYGCVPKRGNVRPAPDQTSCRR